MGSSTHPSLSGDGRYVVFESGSDDILAGDTNYSVDVIRVDLRTGAASRVSLASDGTQANSGSGQASISRSGGQTAFTSFASNLVPGDTNAETDVFVAIP
jgi:Tol biopolymer transport system component